MRKLLSIAILFCTTSITLSQNLNPEPPPRTHKNDFYIYWGWNWDWYTKSDIHFVGTDFDFRLYDVKAVDKQKEFSIDYFNPTKLTIPQTNFRVGYFLNDKYNISIGFDHMKYVVAQYQDVSISGTIENTLTEYNGVYDNDEIEINPNFLLMEHTDGLNYINVELRRMDKIVNLQQWNMGNIEINFIEGAGIGVLFPKSDVTLLSRERNDEFHVAGYGMGSNIGVNITFFNHFFIQGEMKGGFINMPDVRISKNKNEYAKQHFFFLQTNFVIGAHFKLFGYKKKNIKS